MVLMVRKFCYAPNNGHHQTDPRWCGACQKQYRAFILIARLTGSALRGPASQIASASAILFFLPLYIGLHIGWRAERYGRPEVHATHDETRRKPLCQPGMMASF